MAREQSSSDKSKAKLNPGDDAGPERLAVVKISARNAGSGRLGSRACPTCGGTGKIVEGIGGG